jgi:microcystin-dependent protein
MDQTLGEIRLFAGNFAPLGWAFCSGGLLSIAENTALFALLGTTYGGDGQQTFGLPDLRGRVPVGNGDGPGLAPMDLGEMGGETAVTLTLNQIPMHNHTGTFNGAPKVSVSSANASQSAATAGASIATPGQLVSRVFTGSLGFDTNTPDTTLSTASMSLSGVVVSTGISGGSQPHTNMQPFLGMNFIIATEGIFPSRN